MPQNESSKPESSKATFVLKHSDQSLLFTQKVNFYYADSTIRLSKLEQDLHWKPEMPLRIRLKMKQSKQKERGQ